MAFIQVGTNYVVVVVVSSSFIVIHTYKFVSRLELDLEHNKEVLSHLSGTMMVEVVI